MMTIDEQVKRLQEIKKYAIELDGLIIKEYGSHFK